MRWIKTQHFKSHADMLTSSFEHMFELCWQLEDSSGNICHHNEIWSYLKLLEHWQRKHNRAAYVPYLREKNDGKTTVEFGPLVTLGISTSFGLFLQAFQDGKAIYDPGDKITLKDGKWTPHSRSQFRINLNDISAIYQEVREVNLRDSDSLKEEE